MDPLAVFPPEIIHQIWRHLEPADLLAARAVAPHWLASISDCPGAWVTEFSHDWTEFLAVKKAVRSWSSKNISRRTIRNVRDCIFTEFAYYLLYSNGTLEMFSPHGELVRTFPCQVTDLHRGEKCLLIGVAELSSPRIRHRTIITDFVFNYVDDMMDTEIIQSSPNGYYCVQKGECFFSLGPDIPGAMKIPCVDDAQLHFLASCAVIVQDSTTVKTVLLFDSETKSITHLKTCNSSPRWIPTVEILPGPEDYFCVMVEQRDFNKISVYHRDIPLFEDSFPSTFSCVFIEDYFIMMTHGNVTTTAFKLTDFTKHHELGVLFPHDIKSIECESWSLFKNYLSIFTNWGELGNTEPASWIVYRLSERCKSSTGIGPQDGTEGLEDDLEPELQPLARNSISDLSILGFDICPGYAFKMESRSCSGHERVVHLLHFNL